MALLNRLLAALLGLAFVAAGVLLIVEAVVAALGRSSLAVDRQLADRTLAQLSWNDPLLLWVSAGLLALGLVLLVLQLIPRRPAALPLRSSEDRTAAVDRKALAARLADAVRDDHDVAGGKITLTRRAAKLRVRALPGADTDAVGDRVRAAVADLLASYDLAAPPKVKVSVNAGRPRSS